MAERSSKPNNHMSDEIKWNKKTKEERDAAREAKKKKEDEDGKAAYQKKRFSKVYDAWKKNLVITKRTPMEVKAMLESLMKSLNEIVTAPQNEAWKEMSASLIKEKVFAILYLQSGSAKPGDSPNSGPSGSSGGPDTGSEPAKS